MIREDRELLAELSRLNREMTPLALRIMTAALVPPNNSSTPSV